MVNEDELLGFVVLTVSATDADSADTNDGQVEYSVTAGSTPTFILGSATGEISLGRILDRESVDQYVMEIQASDGARSATATVTINVADANDNAPVFNPKTYR